MGDSLGVLHAAVLVPVLPRALQGGRRSGCGVRLCPQVQGSSLSCLRGRQKLRLLVSKHQFPQCWSRGEGVFCHSPCTFCPKARCCREVGLLPFATFQQLGLLPSGVFGLLPSALSVQGLGVRPGDSRGRGQGRGGVPWHCTQPEPTPTARRGSSALTACARLSPAQE